MGENKVSKKENQKENFNFGCGCNNFAYICFVYKATID